MCYQPSSAQADCIRLVYLIVLNCKPYVLYIHWMFRIVSGCMGVVTVSDTTVDGVRRPCDESNLLAELPHHTRDVPPPLSRLLWTRSWDMLKVANDIW